MASVPTPTKGRPEGSLNVKTIQSVTPPACPKCGSTERGPYRLVTAIEHAGTTSTGRQYSHVVNRRTMCTACGQVRIDRFFETRKPALDPGQLSDPEPQSGK